MQLRELTAILEELAPLHYAESWDNVGLLLGDPDQTVNRVLVTIDYTPAVAKEAAAQGCDAVIAYHPPWFGPLKRLTAPHPLFAAARAGVALYSPHTALDVAPGGTNDVLADALGLMECRPLRYATTTTQEHKLVTFVPADQADAVCDAMFAAGAGIIGDYRSCSYRSAGTGTFFGGETAQPTVGERGRLERVDELRVETRVPERQLRAVVAALRASHPYEEPAFDIVALHVEPATHGIGRFGALKRESLGAVVTRLKSAMGVAHALVAGDDNDPVQRVAVCAGAGGEMLSDAVAQKADLFVTGEVRHHDALRALSRGTRVVCLLHSGSERAALKPFVQRIRAKLPTLQVTQSTADSDPFRFS